MAVNDVKIVSSGKGALQSKVFRTEAGSSAINPGEPVIKGGTGNNYAILLTDGKPLIGTDDVMGIAVKASTHTASADGEVEVLLIDTDTILECKATTPANIDSASKLLAILNDKVTFDVAAGVFTIDEDEGDLATHGLLIVDGDIEKGTLQFRIKDAAKIEGSVI